MAAKSIIDTGELYRGDSDSFNVRITDTDWLNGKCWFTLKTSKTLDDAEATLQKTDTFITDPDDATKVIATISLTPDETDLTVDKYYYDIQIVSSDGSDVRTIREGTLKVLQDITQDDTI